MLTIVYLAGADIQTGRIPSSWMVLDPGPVCLLHSVRLPRNVGDW